MLAAPDLGDGGGFDGPAEDEVEKGVHAGAVEVLEVDAAHARPLPQGVEPGRQRLPGAHGADEEHQIGVDQLAQEGGRRAVEELEVVDEQDQGTVGSLLEQHRADLGHDGHQVGALVGDARRQEVGQRTERDALESLVAVARATLRPRRSAKARHWSARRVLPRRPTRGSRTRGPDRRPASLEQLQFLVAAHERPLQRHRWAGHALRAGCGHRRRPYRAGTTPSHRKIEHRLLNRSETPRWRTMRAMNETIEPTHCARPRRTGPPNPDS